MLTYYKENVQLYLILFIWLIIGIAVGPLAYGFIPLTMLLMKKRGMYEELFIGYIFILILSDSLEPQLLFAKDVKNFYITILAGFLFLDPKSFLPFNTLYRIFTLFFIFAIFTMMFSLSEPFIFVSIEKTLSFILSFIVVPNFVTKLFRENGPQFFKRFVFFLLTTLLLGFFLRVVAPGVASLGTGRYRGVLGNPNGLGLYAFLIFVIVFVLNNFFPKLFSRLELIIIYLAVFLSIYLTDSRNAIIGIMIFYLFQRFFSVSPFLGFILFIVTFVLAEIISTNLTAILIKLGLGGFFRVKSLENGSGRYVAWAFAWKQIQNNFFIGKGFSYNEYFMRLHYGELNKMGHQGGIHNSFLTFWMDQGLIGLLIYLRSFIIMFIKAAHKTKYALPIMFSISFTAFFESWLVGSLSAFAFLAMVIFTIITSEEIKENVTEENVIEENVLPSQNILAIE